MTSGGDSQGMNGVVRAVVRMSIHMNCDAYAVLEGYEGLVLGGDSIKRMYWDDVRGYLSRGGTLIGTKRCMAFYERSGRLKAARNLILKGINALVICGGDGSLTGADRFRSEWPSLLEELVQTQQLSPEQVEPYRHLNICGLLGSIDNDMSGTDATIGCYSSLERICEMVDAVDDTATSHMRAFVIEVMGRNCGWLALMASIATGADYVFIPEKPPGQDWPEEMCEIVTSHRQFGKRRTIIIISEGAQDTQLEKITADQVVKVLTEQLHLDTRRTVLGHIQRGGLPSFYDRWLSTLQGVEAVKAVLEATPQTPTPVITVRENKILRSDLQECVRLTKSAAKAIQARDWNAAMKLRDAEFKEYFDSYKLTTSPESTRLRIPQEHRVRIAIIHVGAPAAGMNPATRAAVAYCLSRGHTPIAIHNGFPGLLRHHDTKPIGSVREIKWIDVEDWANEGGSELGTNRGLPSEDMAKTAHCFEVHRLEALFIIGGFEAFASASQIRNNRDKYPSLRIPLIVLPATISNNVPGTEYSLGSDTCLNTLVGFCDAIRQSASASRRRVFVVETQGGYSGYLATMTGLAIGALAAYTPDDGIDLHTLTRDIDFIRKSFQNDQGASRAGKIILRNERASQIYTTQVAVRPALTKVLSVADVITAEGRGRFDARAAVPGHYQQGGRPSPIDRIRAFKLAIKCIQFLEDTFAGKSADEINSNPLNATIIGIQGSEVVFSPMGSDYGLEATQTDWGARLPRNQAWRPVRGIIDILSGRPEDKE